MNACLVDMGHPFGTFLLWSFGDSRSVVITRGRTQEEAAAWAKKIWPRGSGFCYFSHLPINSATLYEQNHEKGWMYRAPLWLQKTL